MLGDYAYAAHYPEEEYEFEADTPLAAIEKRVDADVAYAQGCTATGNSTDKIGRAVEAAEGADVALAFVGARSAVDFSDAEGVKAEQPMVPTSGEGCDVTDLGLPGVQERLVAQVEETDTPVVIVLVSGKPHAIPEIDAGADAVVQAWLPGEEAGNAVVDVLFEGHDSGGHLPVSMPKSVGQLPVHYSRKPNTYSEDYVYDDGQPVYNTYPLSYWQPGTVIADRHPLSLPADLAQGDYTLAVGLYDPDSLERWPVVGPDGRPEPDNRALLTTSLPLGATP
jgi:beta-glucosidase